jgi:hypothetical protein
MLTWIPRLPENSALCVSFSSVHHENTRKTHPSTCCGTCTIETACDVEEFRGENETCVRSPAVPTRNKVDESKSPGYWRVQVMTRLPPRRMLPLVSGGPLILLNSRAWTGGLQPKMAARRKATELMNNGIRGGDDGAV